MLNFAILDERKTLFCYKITSGLTEHIERNDIVTRKKIDASN